MVLTGGYATEKEAKWQRKDSSDTEGRLPTGKKDYRMVDVKVVYPKTPYFANYKNYEFINKFSSGKTMAEAYGEKASNGGAINLNSNNVTVFNSIFAGNNATSFDVALLPVNVEFSILQFLPFPLSVLV